MDSTALMEAYYRRNIKLFQSVDRIVLHSVIPGVWALLSRFSALVQGKHSVSYLLDGWSKENVYSVLSPDTLIAFDDLAGLARTEKLLLVYGTRPEMFKNRQLVAFCANHGIATLFMADCYKIHMENFRTDSGEWCLPDAMAVVDETSKQRFLDALDDEVSSSYASRIGSIGWPVLEDSVHLVRSVDSSMARRIRAQYVNTGRLALFVTEPIRSDFLRTNRISLGYDEFSIFERYIVEFASGYEATVIKLHPRQDVEEFLSFLKRNGWHNRHRIFVIRDERIENLIAAADTVYGMTSIALNCAAEAGKEVVSIQAGRTRHGELLSNPPLECRVVL